MDTKRLWVPFVRQQCRPLMSNKHSISSGYETLLSPKITTKTKCILEARVNLSVFWLLIVTVAIGIGILIWDLVTYFNTLLTFI